MSSQIQLGIECNTPVIIKTSSVYYIIRINKKQYTIRTVHHSVCVVCSERAESAVSSMSQWESLESLVLRCPCRCLAEIKLWFALKTEKRFVNAQSPCPVEIKRVQVCLKCDLLRLILISSQHLI